MNRKPEVLVKPDGRVILNGWSYTRMKSELRHLAGSHCERCGKFTTPGEVDHIHGRGLAGARRDDRIFVNGERNLHYVCRDCHDKKHNPKACPPKVKLDDREFREMLGIGGTE